jgi:hypothetical protein
VQAWRERGVSHKIEALGSPPPGWLMAYRNYFADSGWEDKTPRVYRRMTEWPPEAHPPGEDSGAAAANAAATGSELAVARAPAPAAPGKPAPGGAKGGPSKERAFAGDATQRFHHIPHTYSVRPPM